MAFESICGGLQEALKSCNGKMAEPSLIRPEELDVIQAGYDWDALWEPSEEEEE